MQTEAPAVHIVDDDESIRDALSLLLASEGIECRLFASGDDFLQAYDASWRGCILLDIQMPGTSGLSVQDTLREKDCTMPVIFVTGHGDVPMAVEALHQGAFDFIQKPYKEAELLDRIRPAIKLNEQAQAKADELADIKGRYETLTPREREVMAAVVGGDANKVVAMDLGLSQRTVEIHRSRVMDKMQARSLASLVRMSMELAS